MPVQQVWFVRCLGSCSQEWKELMEPCRWGDMKKPAFYNLAWQIFLDVILIQKGEYLTTNEPESAGKPWAKQHGGSLMNAIRSQMPGFGPAELAAEEFVDTILRIEIIEGRIPVEVCSPVRHPAWESHQQVRLE